MGSELTIQFFVECRRRCLERGVLQFYSASYDDRSLNGSQRLLGPGFCAEGRAHFEDFCLHIIDLNAKLLLVQQFSDEYCVDFGTKVHVDPLEEDRFLHHSSHLQDVHSCKDWVQYVYVSHLRHSLLVPLNNFHFHTSTH